MNELLVKELQQQVVQLEEEILKCPQVDVPMLHWVEGNCYYRAILVCKNTLITGARHLSEHECISIGCIAVSTDNGMKVLTGHHHFWSQAGKKRVGLALEDTIWLTKHWTNRQSLEGKEEEISFPEEHEKLAEVRSRNNRRSLLGSNVLTKHTQEIGA